MNLCIIPPYFQSGLKCRFFSIDTTMQLHQSCCTISQAGDEVRIDPLVTRH
jgi:hypothetical protein